MLARLPAHDIIGPVNATTMRAFVVTAPGSAGVHEVDAPVAQPGEVVIDVERVGVCGTDVEFFTGEMAYLHDGHARFPIRLGHEWAGTVSAAGRGRRPGLDRPAGDRRHHARLRRLPALPGRHTSTSASPGTSSGIRGGRPGALAEQLAMPVAALHALPATVDAALGALVEPGGNALRSVRAAGLSPATGCSSSGAGTIGLLVAMFARAAGAEVHLLGRSAAVARLRADPRFRRRVDGRHAARDCRSTP